MRLILITLTGLLLSNLCLAKIRCSNEDEAITIDPHHKKVSILKDGHTTDLKIISKNHHAYKLFGDSTYEVQGGFILGIKNTSASKNLTVFKDGAPVSSISGCTL